MAEQINNLSMPRMSLNSHRIFTNNTEKQSKIKSVNMKIESLFFDLHVVMKTVVVSKILHDVLRTSWNFISDHCLHHIMKVEK